MNFQIRIILLIVLVAVGYFSGGHHGVPVFTFVRIGVLVAILWTLKGVGKRALAKQPASIHMIPAGVGAWNAVPAAKTFVEGILALGFQEAGSYTIQEMPGVKVHFQVHPTDSAYACVYEHPKAGKWINFISKYLDGTSITFSNQGRGAALSQRPGHPIVHAAGLDPASLYARFKAERPQENLLSLTAGQLVGLFESAYAESLAWRKKKGVSAEEVLKVNEESLRAKAQAAQMAALAAAATSVPAMDLPLYIARNGQQEGPFRREQVLAEISAGRLTREDYGWHEGLTEWVPLSTILI